MIINRYRQSKIITTGKLIDISISHNYLSLPLMRACEIYSFSKYPVVSAVLLTDVLKPSVRSLELLYLTSLKFCNL